MDHYHSRCLQSVLAYDKQESKNLSGAELTMDCLARSELAERFSKNSNARQSIETEIQRLQDCDEKQDWRNALRQLRDKLRSEIDVKHLSICTSA